MWINNKTYKEIIKYINNIKTIDNKINIYKLN